MIIVNSCLLHHFIPKIFSRNCILLIRLQTLYTDCPTFTKEVIRPQVPLRPPCYDFSLVADPRFDSAN